jgi:PKD repeat protein
MNHTKKVLMVTVILLIYVTSAQAVLTISSVTPNTVKKGESVTIKVEGEDFDRSMMASFIPDVGNRKYITKTFPTTGRSKKLLVYDHYLIVLCASRSDGWNGIQILDIQQADQPQTKKYIAIDYYGQDIVIYQNRLFLVTREASKGGKLIVINIASPENASIQKEISLDQQPQAVCVRDNRVYIIDTTQLHIFDIENLNDITKHDPFILDKGFLTDISLGESNNVYVLDHEYQQVNIINAENPSTCLNVGNILTGGMYPSRIVIKDHMAYIADWKGLSIMNLNSMTLSHSITTSGYAESVFVQDNKVYLVDKGGLQVINISDLQNVNKEQLYALSGWGEDVVVTNERAYVCVPDEGIVIIDITQPAQSNIIGELNNGGSAYALAIQDNTAFVANGLNGVQVIDIKQADQPEILQTINTMNYARDIFLQGDYLYVVDDIFGMLIYDISVKTENQPIGKYPLLCGPTQVIVSKNVAYLNCGNNIVQVDVTDKQNPDKIDTIDIDAQVNDMSIASDILFIASDDGLKRYDIEDHFFPDSLFPDIMSGKTIDTLFIADQNVYFTYDETVSVLPVDTIGSSELFVFDKNKVLDLLYQSGRLYVASDEGITVYQIENCYTPAQLAFIPTPGRPVVMHFQDMAMYCVCEKTTLVIIPLPHYFTPNVIDQTELTIDLPPMDRTGHYNLRLINSKGDASEILGAVTIMEDIPDFKAIIIAGVGPANNNNRVWDAIRLCTDISYKVLLYQGFSKDHIRFICPADEEVNMPIYASPTQQVIKNTLAQWVGPVEHLFLFMMSHGDDGNISLTSEHKMHASELDQYLDQFQEQTGAKVTLIYDACHSGSFIPLMIPPENTERFIITSGGNESINFLKNGGLTFSYQFWTYLLSDPNVGRAFKFAKKMLQDYQTPQVDLDGNGIANPEKEFDDITIELVRNYAKRKKRSCIKNVSAPKVLEGEITAQIVVDVIGGVNEIKQVIGIIIPPTDQYDLDVAPITDYPVIDFKPTRNNQYVADINNLTSLGTYHISIYAIDNQGLYTLPKSIDIVQTHQQVHADFFAQPLIGIAPLDVRFTDQTAGEVYSWHWNFGDGQTSQLKNPVNTFHNPGIYSIGLIVSLAGRMDSITHTAYVEVKSPHGISGQVLTQILGHAPQGIPFSIVSIPELNIVSATDNNGDYALELPEIIDPGNYTLTINAPGSEIIRQQILLNEYSSIKLGKIILSDDAALYPWEEIQKAVDKERMKWDIGMDHQINLKEVIRDLQVISNM